MVLISDSAVWQERLGRKPWEWVENVGPEAYGQLPVPAYRLWMEYPVGEFCSGRFSWGYSHALPGWAGTNGLSGWR